MISKHEVLKSFVLFNYTRFRIYGPRWDHLKVDHIVEIDLNLTLYQETLLRIGKIGPPKKLTKYPKRPYIRRPYNRNRVYVMLYRFLVYPSWLLTHLELRPVHGHVDAVRVGPQPQVLVVVRVVHSVVELLVDLREAENDDT